MLTRWSLPALAVLAIAAQAQPAPRHGEAAQMRAVPSRPSTPSRPMVAGAPLPAQPAPDAGIDPPPTALLGGGSFGPGSSGTGLENVLNSGAPLPHERRSAPRKVCPPGLENRNNVCAAPMGSILSR